VTAARQRCCARRILTPTDCPKDFVLIVFLSLMRATRVFIFSIAAIVARKGALFLRASAMAKRLYVGNLKYTVTSEHLQELFERHGRVSSAQVLSDRETGRSRGFGFVEMVNDDEAMAAIEGLDGQDFDGRRLTVNEARPRTPGGTGGSGGPRGGGYRGGGGGGGYGGDY
jgi:uncharacterized membrane protein YgcG